MRRARVATAAVLLLALSACRDSKDEPAAPSTTTTADRTTSSTSTTAKPADKAPDWPTYGGSPTRTAAVDADRPFTQAVEAWSAPDLDAAVYAQPILVGDLAIVATEGNSVYAFDRASGRQRWRAQLGRPVDGATLPCGNINPSGITATPVADAASQTVYVLPFLADGPHHDLVALSLADGSVRWRRPHDPPGLSPRVEQARAALTLVNGRVYAAFGGLAGDCGPYKGAIVSAPADGQGGAAAFVVPTTREGGIWAPPGPSVVNGSMFVATGNTEGRKDFDLGNAVVRLTLDLKSQDSFAPADWADLNATDTDLGSVSPIPVASGRLFVAGKSGLGYLLDPAKLGGIGKPLFERKICGQAIGGAATAAGKAVVSCADGMYALALDGDRFTTAWRHGTTQPGPPIIARGAVWFTDRSGLHAFSLGDGRELARLDVGAATRFTSAASDGARLYVAAGGRLHAFDLR